MIVGRNAAKQAEAMVSEHVRARTDELTGALNRTALDELVTSRAFRHQLEKGCIAILFVDLDYFKEVNDTHGHVMGDPALQVVARRLMNAVRAYDYVFRKGGDEFLCVFIDNRPEASAQRVTKRLLEPIMMASEDNDGPVEIGLSVGVAMSKDNPKWTALLKEADRAMYDAKLGQRRSGREIHAERVVGVA